MKKPITVLGGGNAALTMTADLTLRGFDVNFCEHPRFEKSFKPILERGEIKVVGPFLHGTARIHKVGTNMEEAISDVDIINVAIPSAGHDTFFKDMIPFLKNDQLVLIWAGNCGSLRLAKLLEEEAPEKRILIAEANTMPYGTRIIAPCCVSFFLATKSILFSAFPSKNTKKALEKMEKLFPILRAGQNVLAVSFSNPNPTVHPPGSILNVGRIEYSDGDFYLYREGITESIARVIRAVYDETNRIAKAYGLKMLTYEDKDFRTTGSIMAVEFEAPFDTLGVLGKVRGPSTIYDRYITEDLPYGLVHRSQLGKKVDIPTPIIDSIINIGSVVCQTDFWKGRTLEDLGLAEKTSKEIVRYVEEGK